MLTDGHYAEPRFDAMWAAMSDRGVPVSFHVLTGGRSYDPTLGSGIRLIGLMSPVHHIQNTLGLLMFGKVFDRHPALEVVSAEHDGGWDRTLRLSHGADVRTSSQLAGPGDRARANSHGVPARAGLVHVSEGSDRRRNSSSRWCEAARDFVGVPADEVAAIVGGNAARLYGLS